MSNSPTPQSVLSPPTAWAASDTASRRQRLHRVRRLANFLDTALRIPGTRIRFGADSLLGLIPGVGDVATAAIAALLVREAYMAGVSKTVLLKMVGNVGLDTLIGMVPVLGDLFDVYFKANARNAKLLAKALGEPS